MKHLLFVLILMFSGCAMTLDKEDIHRQIKNLELEHQQECEKLKKKQEKSRPVCSLED